MAATYQSLDEKPYDSFYLMAETILDHPVERVWPRAIEIGAWMDAHDLETLSGRAKTIGHFERVLPRNLGAEVGHPRYHLYGIAYTIPHKLIALEVFPEKGGSYGEARPYVSFDTILLTSLDGGRTNIRFLVIDMHEGKGESGFEAKVKAKFEEGQKLIEVYFENLRRNVEASL